MNAHEYIMTHVYENHEITSARYHFNVDVLNQTKNKC